LNTDKTTSTFKNRDKREKFCNKKKTERLNLKSYNFYSNEGIAGRPLAFLYFCVYCINLNTKQRKSKSEQPETIQPEKRTN
jgi:hypothetical protein